MAVSTASWFWATLHTHHHRLYVQDRNAHALLLATRCNHVSTVVHLDIIGWNLVGRLVHLYATWRKDVSYVCLMHSWAGTVTLLCHAEKLAMQYMLPARRARYHTLAEYSGGTSTAQDVMICTDILPIATRT